MTIYKITNKLNQKIYVGQTSQPLEKRFLQHLAARTPLGQAMRDCGVENFVIEVIEECKTYEQTKRQECFWIKVLNCKVPNGYNQSDGGESCVFKKYRPRVHTTPTTGKMTVAESLKRFRSDFKLKQKDVAERLGVSPQVYYRYENGKSIPSVDLIMGIADIFGVTTDYLLGRSDEPRPPKYDEQEVKEAFALRDMISSITAKQLNKRQAATA